MRLGPLRFVGIVLLLIDGIAFLPAVAAIALSPRLRAQWLPGAIAVLAAMPLTAFVFLTPNAQSFFALTAFAAVAWALVAVSSRRVASARRRLLA